VTEQHDDDIKTNSLLDKDAALQQ